MKINNKLFSEFFKKCTLNGRIMTCVIRSDGKEINVKTKFGNTTAVLGKLTLVSEVFNFPVKDSAKLLKILETFGDKISIEVNDNIMKVFDENREAEIILADESYIDNEITKDAPFTYEGSFDVKSSLLKDSIRNASIVNSKDYLFEVKDNVFYVTIGDKNFDKMTEKVAVKFADCKSNFGEIITDVVAVLDKDLKIFLKNDYPIKIEETTKDMSIIYVVAQIVKQEDE